MIFTPESGPISSIRLRAIGQPPSSARNARRPYGNGLPAHRARDIKALITTQQRTNAFYIQSPRLQTAVLNRFSLRCSFRRQLLRRETYTLVMGDMSLREGRETSRGVPEEPIELTGTALDLLDELIDHFTWGYSPDADRYYYEDLLPEVVEHGPNAKSLSEDEKRTVSRLKEALTPGEWQMLPELVRSRRKGEEVELEHDRRVKAKRLQALDERERERKEMEARQRELAARRQALLQALSQCLTDDFLSFDAFIQAHPDRELATREEYLDLKARFVKDWV